MNIIGKSSFFFKNNKMKEAQRTTEKQNPSNRPRHIGEILEYLFGRMIIIRELTEDMSDTCRSFTGQREATQKVGRMPDNGDNL